MSWKLRYRSLVDTLLEELGSEELFDLAAEGERTRLMAAARAKAPTEVPAQQNGTRPARLEKHWRAEDIAERLSVGLTWVYAHKDELGAVSASRKLVLFPDSAVVRYLTAHRG